MADQNISFKVTVNSKEAEAAFRKLADAQGASITQSDRMQNSSRGVMTAWRSQNMLGNQFVNTIRSGTMFTNGFSSGIQGLALNLDGLADEYERANLRGLTFKDVLKQSLSGVSGLAIGITLAVTAITLFTNWMGKQKSATDLATEALKRQEEKLRELSRAYNEFERKAKDPATFMKALSRGDVEGLEAQKSNLELFIRTLEKMRGGTEAEKFKRSLLLTETRKELDDVKSKLEVINASFRNITSNARSAFKNDNVNKMNTSLEKHKATIGFLSVLYKDILSSMEAMSRLNPLRQPSQGLQFTGQVPTPEKPIPNVFVSEAELKDYDAFLFTTMTSTAQSVGNLFKGMWRDIFGEANNLLTDFIGNIISSLADVAARGLAVDLLNLAFPGAGILGGLGLFGSQQSAGGAQSQATSLQKSTSVYNINIGNQTVAQVVSEGYNTAVRLRKL